MHRVFWYILKFYLIAVLFPVLCPQHQQQVVQAMERAKQVTMGELNASIGVRGLPPLPHTVCTSIFSSTFFLHYFCLFLLCCLIKYQTWIVVQEQQDSSGLGFCCAIIWSVSCT